MVFPRERLVKYFLGVLATSFFCVLVNFSHFHGLTVKEKPVKETKVDANQSARCNEAQIADNVRICKGL